MKETGMTRVGRTSKEGTTWWVNVKGGGRKGKTNINIEVKRERT